MKEAVMDSIFKPPVSMTGAISLDRESCQFLLLDEKPTVVLVSSDGERSRDTRDRFLMAPRSGQCSTGDGFPARRPRAAIHTMPCRLPNTKRHRRYTSAIMTLAFLRRPAISLGAGTAHQRRALALAQAVGETEGFDGLFVIDDRECAGPVGAPQAAVEAPGVEHTGERVPDVWEGIGFLGQ